MKPKAVDYSKLPLMPRAEEIPFTPDGKAALLDALRARKRHLADADLLEQVRTGYSLVWLHLCHVHHMDPSRIRTQADRGRTTGGPRVEAAFRAFFMKADVHPSTLVEWWIQPTADGAAELARRLHPEGWVAKRAL